MWITAQQYDDWLARHADNQPEKPADPNAQLLSGEKLGAKFCPVCQYLLVKYKVGHQTNFSLDRCGHCGGVWLDKNEWDILKSRNLHDDVHLMFSPAWQAAVRSEQHEAAMDEIWREHLSEADLSEIRRVKQWIDAHPKAAELRAFLLYNAKKTGATAMR